MASLSEWLVALGVIKKGSYRHYKTEYYIKNPDVNDVMQKIEKYYRAGWRMGALEVNTDYENLSLHIAHSAGTNKLGEQLVHWEMNIGFENDGSVTVVTHEMYDHQTCNARFMVEGCKKSWQKKFAKK